MSRNIDLIHRLQSLYRLRQRELVPAHANLEETPHNLCDRQEK